MEIQQEICHNAPFYVLGPVVTDIAPGYDHITSAIGGTAAAFYGASFLCYVTPREHLGLPDADDVRAGVIAAKIAAHAADVARGLKGAAEKDKNLSIARTNLDWKMHIAESLDPQTAEKMHRESYEEMGQELPSADYCSMCGRNWCSVRINKEISQAIKHQHQKTKSR
jgi:phosphomethylpyrimidine synthase